MKNLRPNIALYAMIAVVAVLSLLVLFRLREQFDRNLQGRVGDLQRVFSSRTLLKSPSDSRITFAEIEAEVSKYENRGDFGDIIIEKRLGETLHTVYPFYLPALQAAGLVGKDASVVRAEGSPWRRLLSPHVERQLNLISDGEVLGRMRVDVNMTPLRTVSLVIWAMGAMLAVSLAFLAGQFRRQEKVISATTVELEEKRRELVRLERLSLAGQLSANILHDLKKPVLNIRNEADEALHPHEGYEPESPPNIFKRMREQADFFLSVLRDGGYDRFVRSSEEREYVDINDLLERSLALVRYEQGSVQIERQFGSNLPAVLAVPVRLIQVFSNLIMNACQAMEGRGQLKITTTAIGESQVQVQLEDTGPGIPPDKLEKIFEPFFTTKAAGQGTGLGLYIAKDIIQELGGQIHVESRPGRTEFTVLLPAAK